MSKSAGNLRLVYSKDEVVTGLGIANAAPSTPSARGNKVLGRQPSQGLPSEFYVRLKDGERTHHLTKLVGKLIQQRYPIDAVKALARTWNQNNLEQLPVGKVDTTCEGIWETHLRNHEKRTSEESENPYSPLFEIETARVSAFLSAAPKARNWLLKDCLPYGKVGALVAPGGTGKSQALLQLGISVATGLPFLEHWDIPNPGGALILLAEDDEEEIHQRVHNIYLMLSASNPKDAGFAQKIKENLFVKSMVAENNLMTAATADRGVGPTGYAQRLVATAKAIHNLKLIVIDPASRFRGGLENSAEDVTRFVEELEYIKVATGASVMVAHHANKGSLNAIEVHQNAARGSSAFTDGVRWQMNLSTLKEADAKNLKISPERRRFYLAATIVKNNYAPPIDPVILERKDGGYLALANVERLAATSDSQLLAEVQKVLRTDAKAGAFYSCASFEAAYGGKKGHFKIGKVQLRKLLSSWADTGKLWRNTEGKLTADKPDASRQLPSSGKATEKSIG